MPHEAQTLERMAKRKLGIDARAARGQAPRVYDRSCRHEIPCGGVKPPADLVRKLKAKDICLELLFHHGVNRWVLYRLIVGGAAPSMDVLVKVKEIKIPLGDWLIQWLTEHDISCGGTYSPSESTGRVLTQWDRDEFDRETRAFMVEQELFSCMAEDAEMIARRRMSVTLQGPGQAWHAKRKTAPSKPVFISLRTGRRLSGNEPWLHANAVQGLHR